MKKIFAQPEMMVVNIKKNDIVTGSTPDVSLGSGYYGGSLPICAPGRDFDSWNEGF